MSTFKVSAGSDDADQFEDGSGFSRTNSQIVVQKGLNGSIRKSGAFRFQNVNIPQGAVITNASMSMVLNSSTNDDPDCDIHCEAIDDSLNFIDNATVVGRSRTTANTNWAAGNIGLNGDRVDSPDFTSAVQEVINRAGWLSGNAMTVILHGHSGSGAVLDLRSYDNSGGAYPAILTIDYVGEGGGGHGGRGGGRGGGSNGVGGGAGMGGQNNRGNHNGQPGGVGGFDKQIVGSKKRLRLGVL